MSERGRGSEPPDDDLGDEAAEQPATADYPIPPPVSRPIAPYDPYRSSSAGSQVSRRNVAAEGFESSRVSRTGPSPFLPDDDPLSADAWQLEFGEIEEPGNDLDAARPEPHPDPPPATRRTKRQPATARPRREAGSAPGRLARRSRAAATTRERPAVTLAMPRAVSGASLMTDPTMLALLGINVASILVMALVLGVRLGGMPPTIVLRLDAAGNPALWGPPSVLWRLPIMSLFITAMFLIVAWFVHPIDRFAARFTLAAAVVAQVIAWVAVILHLA